MPIDYAKILSENEALVEEIGELIAEQMIKHLDQQERQRQPLAAAARTGIVTFLATLALSPGFNT